LFHVRRESRAPVEHDIRRRRRLRLEGDWRRYRTMETDKTQVQRLYVYAFVCYVVVSSAEISRICQKNLGRSTETGFVFRLRRTLPDEHVNFFRENTSFVAVATYTTTFSKSSRTHNMLISSWAAESKTNGLEKSAFYWGSISVWRLVALHGGFKNLPKYRQI